MGLFHTDQALVITCTQPEGHRLRHWVERLRNQAADDHVKAALLDDLLSRVDCANAIAQWLREYVRLDMPRDEVSELLAAWRSSREWSRADQTLDASLDTSFSALIGELSAEHSGPDERTCQTACPT